MKYILRFFVTLLILIILLGIGGYALYNNQLNKPLPQHSGTINLAELDNEVNVYRDEFGIPHITASTTHDLFFAQGYTQAQDRWWQMEFSRHTGHGQLSELIGYNEDVFGIDVFIRTVGWHEAAKRDYDAMDEDAKAVLHAFADGVNAYIADKTPSELALEYTVLGLTGIEFDIQPWTPIDSLVWGKVMAWDLGSNRSEELSHLAMQQFGLSDDMIADYFPTFAFDQKPTVLQEADIDFEAVSAANIARRPSDAPNIIAHSPNAIQLAGNVPYNLDIALGYGQSIGSNNWVVSGDLTESGQPLLASDMHLSVGIPALWYEVGLYCQPVTEACPYQVRGFALSPVPAIIVGHNADIAWAVTNVGGDVQDMYTIKLADDNPLQYVWNDDLRDITTREETITFGDDTPPVTFTVRETHHGAILNDNNIEPDGTLSGFNSENPMAMHWVATSEISTLLPAILKLNQATDWDTFREALSYWDAPAQNFVYADTQGNIGYQMPGKIPVRQADHSGMYPVDGTTDTYEWLGYIPYEAMPSAYNPERGYIASANQVSAPQAYYDTLADALGGEVNVMFQTDVALAYRGERIHQLIEENAPHNAEQFAAIHGDTYAISAAEIVPYVTALDYEEADIAAISDLLADWNYRFDGDSGIALFYAYFWRELVTDIFSDQLPPDETLSGGERTQWAVYQLMSKPENIWWDDTQTEEVTEQRDDIIRRAFVDAANAIRNEHGNNTAAWRWDAAHTVKLYHNPLGVSGVSAIEDIFNSATFPNTGTDGSVNNMRWHVANGHFETDGSVVSMRMIADLSDLTQSLSVIPTGQSGHPAHPNYADQIRLWIGIEYHPMGWIDAPPTQAQLTLSPE